MRHVSEYETRKIFQSDEGETTRGRWCPSSTVQPALLAGAHCMHTQVPTESTIYLDGTQRGEQKCICRGRPWMDISPVGKGTSIPRTWWENASLIIDRSTLRTDPHANDQSCSLESATAFSMTTNHASGTVKGKGCLFSISRFSQGLPGDLTDFIAIILIWYQFVPIRGRKRVCFYRRNFIRLIRADGTSGDQVSEKSDGWKETRQTEWLLASRREDRRTTGRYQRWTAPTSHAGAYPPLLPTYSRHTLCYPLSRVICF